MSRFFAPPNCASWCLPSFSQPTRLAVTEPDGITREIGQPADHSGENLLASFPAEFRSELPPNQGFLRVVKRSGAGTFHALRFVPEADLGTYRSILSAILAISGIILILAFPRVSALFARRFISIQWKIPLLFFYSIVIPMAGAALLGYQTLRDRRETMEAEVHQEALRILAGLDSGFILEKKHALRQFEGFRRDVRQATATSTLASLSENLRKTGEITFAEIRDRFARTLYTTWNADEKVRLALLMDTIAKVCLKRFHPSPPTARGALDLTVAEVFTQSFFLSPMVGWPRILERPEELHSLKFAGRDLFLYWSILTDARNPSAYIQLQQNVSLLQRLYLRQRLRDRMAFRQGEFRFLVWNELSGDLVPKDQVFGGEVRNFFQRLRITQETLREEIRIGETRYLGSGFPGRQLGGHYLVALYPMAIFDTALRNFTVLFFLGTLGICFLVLVFGLALSESFLIPIQELSDGVLALRERDVSRRVAVSIGDELGALAATFNQTLDGLQEMLLAHEVQRELIPHELPAIPGYQAKLMSHPARDLGGDYCDMQPLAEGRYCLVIGDATGHNVSSALVMAMAKAGVLDFLAEGSSPLELMKRLNILFFRHFQRKVNMTFFAAVLEPATGRLRFSNAGHPFPVLIDQEGKVSRLKLSHPPLGFSSRDDRFQENEVTIAPGSMVFFFTDLLMEICDPHGVPWGSKRLIEFVRERRAQAPGRLSEDLFQMARDYSGSDSFEDDFTLMILKRDSIGS